jgi:hypothetical protein
VLFQLNIGCKIKERKMDNRYLRPQSVEAMKKALTQMRDSETVNESDRAKHYKSATPPEMMKDKLKGKGAEDMMKPAQDAIANPTADEQDMVDKDAKKQTANVKVAGGPPKKNSNKGDSKIIPGGTPVKKTTNEAVSSADKKPENYTDGEGKERTRMVKTNRNVIRDSFVVPEEIDVKERTAFMGAAAAAHKAGKKSFSFGGKTHPVTMKKDTAAAVSDSTDPWADMDLDAIELDEDPFHDVPSRPQWITDAYNEMDEEITRGSGKKSLDKSLDKLYGPKKSSGKPGMKAFRAGESPYQKRIKKITGKDKLDSPHMQPQKEDMDNKMFVLRKQARVNQRRIDKGMKPMTPLHPDHKNLIKPMKKKVGMSEKSSVNYKDIDGKTVNEISKDLAKAYMKGRSRDIFFTGKKAGEEDIKSTIGMKRPSYKKSPERKAMKMMKGMDTAANKIIGRAKVPAQGKKGRNVRDQY